MNYKHFKFWSKFDNLIKNQTKLSTIRKNKFKNIKKDEAILLLVNNSKYLVKVLSVDNFLFKGGKIFIDNKEITNSDLKLLVLQEGYEDLNNFLTDLGGYFGKQEIGIIFKWKYVNQKQKF